MTKEKTLNEFQTITKHFSSPFQQIEYFSKKLTKKQCNMLLDMARYGNFVEFRLFKTHGYALDHCYNRYYIYDWRKK